MWLKLLAALVVAVTGTGVGLYYASEEATAPASAAVSSPPAYQSPCCAARMKRQQEQESVSLMACSTAKVSPTVSAADRGVFAACAGGVSLVGTSAATAKSECCEE